MNIVGMLRIKDESRWIADVLRSIQPVCDHVLVFDDHSSDGTPEICESFGARVWRSEFDGLDEVRDKQALLNWVRNCFEPDWVLHIDGDEILDKPHELRYILSITAPGITSYRLRVRYLWNSHDQERVDGIYANFRRGSLFRLAGQPGPIDFRATGNGGNFHCGNVPRIPGTMADLDEPSLLHLGYLSQTDRLRKFAWYSANDPDNIAEDCYRHMIQGDVPEIPASMRLKHAGPLQLRSMNPNEGVTNAEEITVL
jgi:glycosyltransferase involved in cell wall biosynthesis